MFEVLVTAIANFLTRFLPFVFLKKHADRFLFLKDDFPVVLLVILVLYIIIPNELNFNLLFYQIIGIFTTVLTYLIFRRFLLSIFAGCILYVILINMIVV